MNKHLFLFLMLNILLVFSSCQDDSHDQEKNQPPLYPEIDMHPFSDMDEDILTRVGALQRSELPSWIQYISLMPNKQEIEKGGESRQAVIAGSTAFTAEIRMVDFITRDIISGTQKTIISNGLGEVSETITILPFYNTDPYGLRILEFQCRIVNYDDDFRFISLHHQYPIETLFTTNLRSLDYMVPSKDAAIKIIKTGDYPNANGQIVNFRAIVTGTTTEIGRTQLYEVNTTEIEMSIDNHNGENRSFEVQYRTSLTDWTTFDHGVQTGTAIGNIYIVSNATNSFIHTEEGPFGIFFFSKESVEGMPVRLISTRHIKYNIPASRDTLFYAETTARDGAHSFLQPANGVGGYAGHAYFTLPDIGVNGWHPNYFQYDSNETALWTVQYHNGKDWVSTHSFIQSYYSLCVTNNTINVPASGATWTLKYSGFIPIGYVWFKAVDQNGTQLGLYVADHNPNGNNASGRINLTIPANQTRQKRNIYLHISIDAGKTWDIWNNTTGRFHNWKAESPVNPWIEQSSL